MILKDGWWQTMNRRTIILTKFGTHSTQEMQIFLYEVGVTNVSRGLLSEKLLLKYLYILLNIQDTWGISGYDITTSLSLPKSFKIFFQLACRIKSILLSLHCKYSVIWCWFTSLVLSPEISTAPLMYSMLVSRKVMFPTGCPWKH